MFFYFSNDSELSWEIKVVGDIVKFYEHGVILKSGEKKEFDSVILATGYRARVDDFLENVNGLAQALDKNQYPKQVIGKGSHEGLYFVGFDNYKLGGILGTIFTDSETIVEDILKSKLIKGERLNLVKN